MVRKIFGFFYKETSRLHQAALMLASFSLLSQLLAFLRDRGLAHIFGASESLDIYYAAFRIPDFIFVTIASVVSLSVLVPFIVEREQGGHEKVKEFVDSVFSFFSILIIVSCLLAFFLMPQVSSVLFKGFEPEALQQAIFLSRVLLLSPVFLGLSNLFGSLTQAYNRFLIYAFAPVLYNAGIIFGIFILAPHFGVSGVAYGVVLGSMMHALIQVPFVLKIGLMPRFRILFGFANIRRVVALSFPRTLTLSTTHISSLFLVSLASLMTAGSISVFTLAQNISSVPLSIIGVSYSLAAFPTLSRHFSEKNLAAFSAQMATTVRHIIFWSLPAMALFVVLRAQIVRVLLGTGSFDWNDTRLTAASLAIFSLSALSQCLMLLFVRAFYSAGHTRKPLIMNVISALILIASAYGAVKLYHAWPAWNYFFAALFRVQDVPGNVVLMLPLGFSIGTIANSIIHWVSFEKDFGRFSQETYHTLFVSLASAVAVGIGAYAGLQIFESVFATASLVGIFLQSLAAGILGAVLGVGILWLLKSHELRELWLALHQKFAGVEPVAENSEIV